MDELVEAKAKIKNLEQQIEILQIDAENYKPIIERYEKEVECLQAELKTNRQSIYETDDLRSRLRAAEQTINVLRGIIVDIALRIPNNDYV